MIVLRVAVQRVDEVVVAGDVHGVVTLDVVQTRENGPIVDLECGNDGIGPTQRIGHGPAEDMAGVTEIAERLDVTRVDVVGLGQEERRAWREREVVCQIESSELVIAPAGQRVGRLHGPGSVQIEGYGSQRSDSEQASRGGPAALTEAGQPGKAGTCKYRGREVEDEERPFGRAGMDALEAGEKR